MAIQSTSAPTSVSTERYARCIAASKQVRWEIDADVIRNRELDFSQKFLPDGLTGVAGCGDLNFEDQRLISQIQGRTYANMFGLVERYINAKVIEAQGQYVTGDQIALEALVRFSDEELKHQELFRRIETMTAAGMPKGYAFDADPNAVAEAVLSHSNWSVLGLTLVIELFTLVHYKSSIERGTNICPLFKDVFLYHWKEESQHAILDELEWRREDDRMAGMSKDSEVDDLIQLVVAVDGILQHQATSDAAYFLEASRGSHAPSRATQIERLFLDAYRWQYILSGTSLPRFQNVLGSMISSQQLERIVSALDTLAPKDGSQWAPMTEAA
jgi:hypothetical protein